MKEKEFLKRMKEEDLMEWKQKIFYGVDDEGNIFLDEEGLMEEIEWRINKVKRDVLSLED